MLAHVYYRFKLPLSLSSVFILVFVLFSLAPPTFAATNPVLDIDGHHNGEEMSAKPGPANGLNAPHSGPGTVPLDVERYPQPPPELELEQVHIYVRHGKS